MKQARWLYTLIAVYVIAAFSWWTFLLVRYNNLIHYLEQGNLQHQAELAQQELVYLALMGSFQGENALPFKAGKVVLRADTALVRHHLTKAYPDLVLHIKAEPEFEKAFNFSKNPVELNRLEKERLKRQWMFISEATVFAFLLSWGFVVIFRSYRQKVALGRQQNNFLMSVTHELKTPLASAQLMLQTLQHRQLDEIKQKSLLGNALKDLGRLNNLMEKILLASKLDGANAQKHFQEVHLSSMCEEVFNRFVNLHPNGFVFNLHLSENVYLHGDSFMLESLVSNLLENAAKYSPDGGLISLTLNQTTDVILLSVADQGVGIPETERNRIFEKFYRVGSEETRTTKGTGLGLFIVSDVVKQHKAKIKVLDNEPKGTIFEIQFPI